MIRSVIVFLLLALVSGPVWSQYTGKYDGIITGNGVRIRGEASTKGKVVGQLVFGDRVQVLKQSNNAVALSEATDCNKFYWYSVNTQEGLTGWVYGKFLSMLGGSHRVEDAKNKMPELKQKSWSVDGKTLKFEYGIQLESPSDEEIPCGQTYVPFFYEKGRDQSLLIKMQQGGYLELNLGDEGGYEQTMEIKKTFEHNAQLVMRVNTYMQDAMDIHFFYLRREGKVMKVVKKVAFTGLF